MEGRWLSSLDGVHRFWDIQESDSYLSETDAEAYMLAGYIYTGFGDYINAAKYYGMCLAVCKRIGLDNMAVRAAGNLCVIYCYLGDERQARLYYEEASEKSEGLPSSQRQYIKHIIEAYLERKFGSPSKAVTLMKECLHLVQMDKTGNLDETAPLSELTEMYEKVGMLDSALHYLHLYSYVADEKKQLDMQTESLRMYMRIYTFFSDLGKLGDFQRGLKMCGY